MIWTNSARRRDSRSRPMRPGRGTARRVYERVSVHAEAKSTNPTLWHDLGAPITEPRRPLPDFGVLPSPPRAPDGRMPTPHRPLVIRVGKRLRRLADRPLAEAPFAIRRASCRDRGCQYEWISGVSVSL